MISVLLCLGDRWLPSCVSTATKPTAFLGGPFSTAVFPLRSRTRASSLKGGSPSHFLMSSPCSRRKNQSAPHSMRLGLPLPVPGAGGDWLLGAPLTAKALARRDEEGQRFSSKFWSQDDTLSTVGVPISGQYLAAKLLEYDAGALWITFLHMARVHRTSSGSLETSLSSRSL